MDDNRRTFVSKDGHTLDDLNATMRGANGRLEEAREALQKKELELAPFCRAYDDAQKEKGHIGVLLNRWWNEFRQNETKKSANKKTGMPDNSAVESIQARPAPPR